MNETDNTYVEKHETQLTRTRELKARAIFMLDDSDTTVRAAIAVRLLTESATLLKATGDSVLIVRSLNGEKVTIPHMLQISISNLSLEALQIVARQYIEKISPFADRLLDAAETWLDGDATLVDGESPDLSRLIDFRRGAEQIAEQSVVYVLTHQDADPHVIANATIAGWMASDVFALANSADSLGMQLQDFMVQLLSESDLTEQLRQSLIGLEVRVLVGPVMTEYHRVIIPIIEEIDASVRQIIPREMISEEDAVEAPGANIESPTPGESTISDVCDVFALSRWPSQSTRS